jgi:hypothetical protein
MSRRPRQPAPGEWEYSVGEVPHLLTAHERADRGNRIYTRVWTGKAYVAKKALCGSIRGADGKIDPELEQEARDLAMKRQREVRAGLVREAAPSGPLTLAAGFRRLLDPKEGKYPAKSEHAADVRRAGEIIVDVLGADVLWGDVRHLHYRKLWREMINRHVRTGRYGPRWIELVCETLASAARWLQQEGLIEAGDAEPARGWKASLRKEWEQITRRPRPAARKPRHSAAESAALFAALPEADPRIALAVEIGAELRLGQVVRARRADVEPSADGAEPLWMVRVRGRGKKLGEDVVLTDQQRQALRHALETGYLAELEAARAAGTIEDFHLFPAGQLYGTKLPDGGVVKRARATSGGSALGRSGLRKHFRDLERLAGVPHQPGRLWYGLRRRGADDAEGLQDVPAAVKNRMGGWSKSSTREGYLESGRTEDAIAAAEVRRRIRPKVDRGLAAADAEDEERLLLEEG